MLSKLYIVHDLSWTGLSLVLAWWIRFNTNFLPDYAHLSFHNYMSILAVALPSLAVGAGMTGLYSATRNIRSAKVALQVAKSVVLMTLVVMSFLYFDKQVHYSRAVLIMFVGFTWLFVVLGRTVLRRILSGIRSRGFNRKFVLVVGITSATSRFLDRLHAHGELGYQVIGYLDLEQTVTDWLMSGPPLMGHSLLDVAATAEGDVVDSVKCRLSQLGVRCLGTLEHLDRVLQEQIVDHVVLTLPHEAASLLSPLIAVAESHGVHAILVPDFVDILPSRPRFEEFAGLPIIDTRYTPLDDAINSFGKRAFDIVFSLFVLVVLSPVFAVLAIGIRLTSPGPIIYRQQRLGKNRRRFDMYKFRTMIHTRSEEPKAADDAEEQWTVADDPRRTSIGSFLRSTSLDELPQFWNVLRGDMSVIGPRPERPYFAEQFRNDIPRYMVKHRVRPGITGWAQVNGLRGDTSIEERIEYDLRYIEAWSFGWDMRIVALTLLKGMLHRNAY